MQMNEKSDGDYLTKYFQVLMLSKVLNYIKERLSDFKVLGVKSKRLEVIG